MAKANGEVIQKTHFYPFGMSFADSEGANEQPYLYNGKEYDGMHGLNLYDYAVRFYDPEGVRFTSMDPLAEKYYSWSSYAYVENNPLRFIDPDGKQIGVPVPTPYGPVPLPPPLIPSTGQEVSSPVPHETGVRLTNAIMDASEVMSGRKFIEPLAFEAMTYLAVVTAFVMTKLSADATTSDLNRNLPPDGNWIRNQQKSAEEMLFKQSQVGQTGGHNPKDPGGDFNPNIDPKKVTTALKAIAVGTGAAVGYTQYKGLNDARKDLLEQGQLQGGEAKNNPNYNTSPNNPTVQHSDATRVAIPFVHDKYKQP